MTTYLQRLLLSSVLALSVALPAMAADKKEKALRPEVEIDRSVLKDLKGYEPPPMFGASSAPLARKIEPPAAAMLTVPKAEDVLEFPVQNTEVITRQRMTAPEDHVATARPDYSDSHTTLDMTPPALKTKKDKQDVAATTRSNIKVTSSKKPPLPPRKPAVELAAANAKESVAVVTAAPKKEKEEAPKVKEAEVKPSSKPAAAEKVADLGNVDDDLPVPPPMKKAEAAPKYVPKAKPTMPAVPSEKVDRAKLDAFNLPMEGIGDDIIAADVKPTAGERMIDQAMQQRMVDVSKDDIKTILEGGKASETAPLTTTAALDKKSPAKEEPITMEFKSRLTNLQTDQETALKEDILPRLKANPNQRLQIQAFASHNSNEESEARRISLARALAVRAFLLGNGIDPSRMDVRALGSNTTSKMTDRVDLVFLGQS